MWPPSSGRNGNRLITPSERLITRQQREGPPRVEREGLPGHLVAPDDARYLLALLGLEIRASATPSRW